MKKLMMAVAIVCAAVGVQAANIQWNVTAKAFQNYAGTSYSGITSYLFAFASADEASDLYSELKSGAVTFADAIDTYSVGSAVGNTSTSSKSAGKIATSLSSGMLSEGTQTYFAMFSEGDEAHFILSEAVKGTPYATDPDQGSPANFTSSQFTTSTDVRGGWTEAVPEPTSGLLLLLGMAGLALRRRRA